MSYDADQQNRMNRAKYEAMHFIEFDEQRQTAIIENSTHDSYYTVTMNSCTCPDFQKRGVPCKHIYKLREAIDNPASPIRPILPASSSKNKTVALVLCIFLGYFGAHYFYAGRSGMGLLYLFTVGLFGIGWLVDIFRICANRFNDRYGRKISEKCSGSAGNTAAAVQIIYHTRYNIPSA